MSRTALVSTALLVLIVGNAVPMSVWEPGTTYVTLADTAYANGVLQDWKATIGEVGGTKITPWYPNGWNWLLSSPYNSTIGARRIGLWSQTGDLLPGLEKSRKGWWTDNDFLNGNSVYSNETYSTVNGAKYVFDWLTKGMGFTVWRDSVYMTPSDVGFSPFPNNQTLVDQWYQSRIVPGGEWWYIDQFLSYADNTNFEYWAEMAPGYSLCDDGTFPRWNDTLTFQTLFLQKMSVHPSFVGFMLGWHEGVRSSDCTTFSSIPPYTATDFDRIAVMLNNAKSYNRKIVAGYGWHGQLESRGVAGLTYVGADWGNLQPSNPLTTFYRYQNDSLNQWEGGNGFTPLNPATASCPAGTNLQQVDCELLYFNKPVWIDATLELGFRAPYLKYLLFSNPPLLDMNQYWLRSIYNRHSLPLVKPSNFGDYLDFATTWLLNYNSAQSSFKIVNSTARIDELSVSGNTMRLKLHGYYTKYWMGWQYNATMAIHHDPVLTLGAVNGTVLSDQNGMAVVAIPFNSQSTPYNPSGATQPNTDLYQTVRITLSANGGPLPLCPNFAPLPQLCLVSYLVIGLVAGFVMFWLAMRLKRRRRKVELTGAVPETQDKGPNVAMRGMRTANSKGREAKGCSRWGRQPQGSPFTY